MHVRSGIWTHALCWGPECLKFHWTKVFNLESGALDRSAILTFPAMKETRDCTKQTRAIYLYSMAAISDGIYYHHPSIAQLVERWTVEEL